MRGFLIFVLYVLLEAALAVWIASLIGWLAVFGLIIAGFVLGLIVMREAGFAATEALRQASQTGNLPPGKVGDSAVLFAGGLLIAIPGFMTDVIGLLLTISPLRRLARRWGAATVGRRLRARGMSVVTTTVGGATVTRVVPGDVVVGDVIRRSDDFSAGPTKAGSEATPEVPTKEVGPGDNPRAD